MSRFSIGRAVVLAAAMSFVSLAAFGRQPETPEKTDLTGKHELAGGGYLVVSVDDRGRVEGFFERDGQFGRLSGRTNAGTASAVWVQEAGSEVCETAIDGSPYWGRLTLTRDAAGALRTVWSNCDSPVEAEPVR